jgi:hypothetical protein
MADFDVDAGIYLPDNIDGRRFVLVEPEDDRRRNRIEFFQGVPNFLLRDQELVPLAVFRARRDLFAVFFPPLPLREASAVIAANRPD